MTPLFQFKVIIMQKYYILYILKAILDFQVEILKLSISEN